MRMWRMRKNVVAAGAAAGAVDDGVAADDEASSASGTFYGEARNVADVWSDASDVERAEGMEFSDSSSLAFVVAVVEDGSGGWGWWRQRRGRAACRRWPRRCVEWTRAHDGHRR